MLTNEQERQIRKMVDNRFHICTKCNFETHLYEWVLFRKYVDSRVYMSNDNVAIMSSETNTYEEIYDFLKKHHKIDEHFVMGKGRILLALLAFIMTIINIIFIKSVCIRCFIYGVEFVIISGCFLSNYVWNKNIEVDRLEILENAKKVLNKGSDIDES